MKTAPSDRLLTLLGDDVPRICLRALLARPRSQTELAADLHIAQSAVSRSLAQLRAAGWVEAEGLRAANLRVRAPKTTQQLFLAADHLSEELLNADLADQHLRTREDRKSLLAEKGTKADQARAEDQRA